MSERGGLERAGFAETAAAFALEARLGEQLAGRGVLSPAALSNVLRLQRRWGCRLEDVLFAIGLVTPAKLAEARAEQLGVRLVDFTADPPDAALSKKRDLDLYLRNLFVPWRRMADGIVVACADPAPGLIKLVTEVYGPRTQIAVTSKLDIIRSVQRLFRDHLNHEAVFRLEEHASRFSARRIVAQSQLIIASITLIVIAALFVVATHLMSNVMLGFLSVCYLANLIFRLVLFWAGGTCRTTGCHVTKRELAALNERDLPVYSILVPLYREANMVAPVVANLQKLDYPAAKLDIKLVLEEDDVLTIEAAKTLQLDGRFELLRVPASQPRTKPKACNYALRFVRGTYVVIYDAEDRAEPDQLKKAVAAFRTAPRNVACYQARLNFYNSRDNWLTRMFALEYALWFDFLLPGLDRLGVPLPLGGTSNHFRTEILRGLHGWDAFNVTEDADLGMRLAQCGYKVVPLDSSTYEEAAKDFGNWLRQRSRWIKGYMQTWLVHLRSPSAFAAKVGWAPFGGFVLFIGGAIFTGLVCPFFWALFIVWLWTGEGPFGGIFGSASLAVSIASLLIGNGILTVLSILAPVKRRWLTLAPYGITVFIYWLLISVAAYKALWQLITRPFYWEKTKHGLSGPEQQSAARTLAWQAM